MAVIARPANGRQEGAAVPRPARSPWFVLVIILTAVFMQLLDTTITMVGVPSIQNSLHSSFGEIQLVVAGYMLAFACVLVTGGRLGDTYGRKRMFYMGAGLFLIGSVLCGFAWGMLPLIAFRFLQGIGAGAVQPIAYVIVAVVTGQIKKVKPLMWVAVLAFLAYFIIA